MRPGHRPIVHKNNDIREGKQSETRLLTIHPALIFYLQLESPQTVYQSKLHTLRNPMMYNSPKFESEEAAKSQVNPLQNDQRGFSGPKN